MVDSRAVLSLWRSHVFPVWNGVSSRSRLTLPHHKRVGFPRFESRNRLVSYSRLNLSHKQSIGLSLSSDSEFDQFGLTQFVTSAVNLIFLVSCLGTQLTLSH